MTKDKSESVVLGDIGGTNVRFAVLQDGMLSDVEHMKVSEYRQFADALDTFIKSRPAGHPIRRAIFGVAGVVERERCALTNNPWIVAADELRARFGFFHDSHRERLRSPGMVIAALDRQRSPPNRRTEAERGRTHGCGRAWNRSWCGRVRS